MGKFLQSKFAAKLQEAVSIKREESGLYKEIAELLPLAEGKRLLDVGTGTGLQLHVINFLQPGMELYGLDLSAAAIKSAEKHLSGLGFDFRVGSIEKTDYVNDFFDIVTCNASMSYWQKMVQCFNEIHRILKPQGVAIFTEPHKDIDIDAALAKIKETMKDKSPIRRFLAVNLNKFGLRRGGSVGMKLYTIGEIEDMANQSLFGKHYDVEKISLQNLPIFLKITLQKK